MVQLVGAMGFANAKGGGYEADDFLGAAVAFEEQRGGEALVATSDRDALPARERADDDPAARARRLRAGADRAGRGARALRGRARRRCRTSSRSAATRRTSSPARAASGRRRPPTCSANTARWRPRSRPDDSPREAEDLRLYRRIATVDASAPLPPLADQNPTWAEASRLAERTGPEWAAERPARAWPDGARIPSRKLRQPPEARRAAPDGAARRVARAARRPARALRRRRRRARHA